MALSSQEVAALVFKQAVQSNVGELALNGSMLSVLMQFDGRKTLDQVAVHLNMSMAEIKPVVTKLLGAKLIQRVSSTANAADSDFMTFLMNRMSQAIGPLGNIVVKDSLEILGYTRTSLPKSSAAELINILSKEILREDKRIEFKQAMLQKIRDKGYL